MSVDTSELPEGWIWASFRGVAEIASDLVDPVDYQESPHVAPNHIESGTGQLLPYATIARDGVTSPKHRFYSGQILYSKIRPYLCKAVLVDFAGLCSADMYPVSAKIDAHYLHRWMISAAFTELASNHDARTLLPKINQEALATIPVPVPPLDEQKRIAALLEALFARVNAARRRLAKVPALLKRFRQSVLAAACSGLLTADWRKEEVDGQDLPPSWRIAKLGEITTRVTDGTHLPPPVATSGIPFVLIGNVVDKKIDWSAIRKWVTQETYQRLTARCRPERGDVLYTAVGATFGQALLVETDQPFVFQRHIAHVKPKGNDVNAAYLVHVLNSPRQYEHASEVARGAAQPTVTLGDLKEFEIPLPPLSEQYEIVRRVEALFRLTDAIEKRVSAATARAHKLTQAILAKAFHGELVPTEAELARRESRPYEPASVLLEHIRAQREQAQQRPKRRPRR